MKKNVLAIFAVCFLAIVAYGHEEEEYIATPVSIQIRVEPRQIRAEIQSNARYWFDMIMKVPMIFAMPATGWPERFEKPARDYVEHSFQLRMDGQALSIGSFTSRFIQEPLQEKSSRVVFDVSYPIPVVGKHLTGRAQFFSELREQENRQSVFLTQLRVLGPKKIFLELPFEKPDFDIPLEGTVMSVAQHRLELASQYFRQIASSPFFWIALIALGNWFYKRFFKRSEE